MFFFVKKYMNLPTVHFHFHFLRCIHRKKTMGNHRPRGGGEANAHPVYEHLAVTGEQENDVMIHCEAAETDDISTNNCPEASLLISIDQAIEALGTGKFQLRLLIASGLCFAADAMQVILLSFLTLVVQDDWNLSNGMTAAVTSFLFAGSLIGTLVLGPLADTLGRRPIFLLSAIIITLFGFATALAPNYFFLVATIFFVGVGVGGLTVPFDVLAEFLPARRRGTNLLLIEYFWTVGSLYVVLVAYLTLKGDKDEWRIFVGLCSLPCVVSIVVGFLWVPESSRWLAAQGRSEEALQILREAAAVNGLDPEEVYPEGIQIIHEQEEEASFAILFTPAWRPTMLKLWGAWGAFAFGYYGVLLAITKVFEKEDNENERMLASSYEFDFGAIFLSSSAELVGTTIVILAVDKVGRIPSQVFCYLFAGIAVCALCVFDSWDASRSVLVALGFAARVFEMGGTCVTWVSTAEILTTEVRSTGHSTANAVARLGAIFAPIVVEGNTPVLHIGVIMLVVHTFTALCISQLPETKGAIMGSASEAEHSERTSEGLFLVQHHHQDDPSTIEHAEDSSELS